MRDGTLIAAAIVVASLIFSWGRSTDEPRYQLAAAGELIVRMDSDSGAMIACNTQGCSQVRAPDRAATFGILMRRAEDPKDSKLPLEQIESKTR